MLSAASSHAQRLRGDALDLDDQEDPELDLRAPDGGLSRPCATNIEACVTRDADD